MGGALSADMRMKLGINQRVGGGPIRRSAAGVELLYPKSRHSGVDRKQTSVGGGGIGGRGFGGGLIEPELGAEGGRDLGRAPFLLDAEAILVARAQRQAVDTRAGQIDQPP